MNQPLLELVNAHYPEEHHTVDTCLASRRPPTNGGHILCTS